MKLLVAYVRLLVVCSSTVLDLLNYTIDFDTVFAIN